MNRNYTIKLPILLFSIYIVFMDVAVLAAEPLKMGIFPRRNSSITIKMFKPLANYLSKEVGVEIQLETAKNFPTFWENVKAKRYDIAHYNQLHYLMSKDLVGYEVFAKNEEFGKSNISPGIVVRKDSGIKTIKDLKGKKIVFGGGKLAMIAHVAAKNVLSDGGLDKQSYTTMFAKNPPNATMAVFYKKAAAAGIGDVGLNSPTLKKKIDLSQLIFLAVGKPQPHIPWVFKTSLKPVLKEKIRAAISKLNKTPEGKKILKMAGMTGMPFASDEEYNVSREEFKRYKK